MWEGLILGAGLVLLCAWTAGLALHVRGYNWQDFMESSQWLIPCAVVLYLVPWLTRGRGPEGFDLVYRLCGAGLGLLSLLLLSTAGDLCCGNLATSSVAALVPSQASVPRPTNRLLARFLRTAEEGGKTSVREPRFSAGVRWGKNYEPWAEDIRASSGPGVIK